MEVVLIILYTIVFVLLIWKTKWFQFEGGDKKWWITLFLAKVVFAIIYGQVIIGYYGYGDTFNYFRASTDIYNILQDHPKSFFKLIFLPANNPDSQEWLDLFGRKPPFYGLPRDYMFVRILSFFQLFSFGFYKVQAVFFAFLSTAGVFQIVKFCARFFQNKSFLLFALLGFFPSFIFWTSGIHKDAITLFFLGSLLTVSHKILDKKWRFIPVFLILLGFTYWLRNYTLLLFAPALFVYMINYNLKLKGRYAYLFTYVLGGVLFFTLPKVSPKLDFPGQFSQTHDFFKTLKGESNFEMKDLEPNLQGFIELTPTAYNNVFFRPAARDVENNIHLLSAIDNFVYLLLIVVLLILMKWKARTREQRNLILMFVYFSMTFFLTIGLIVTNLGALVRYETTGSMFLLAALVCLADQKKVDKIMARLGITRLLGLNK